VQFVVLFVAMVCNSELFLNFSAPADIYNFCSSQYSKNLHKITHSYKIVIVDT